MIFFRRLSLLNESTGAVCARPALEFETSGGSSGRGVNMDRHISRGARLFFEETFRGNGGTCGTCHPANNNFTIDPEFIAALPANDPLFVEEFNPALAQLVRGRSEPELQHECRGRPASRPRHPDLSEGRRLRTDRQWRRHVREPRLQYGLRGGSGGFRAVLPHNVVS